MRYGNVKEWLERSRGVAPDALQGEVKARTEREFGNLSGLENFAEIVTIADRRHLTSIRPELNEGRRIKGVRIQKVESAPDPFVPVPILSPDGDQFRSFRTRYRYMTKTSFLVLSASMLSIHTTSPGSLQQRPSEHDQAVALTERLGGQLSWEENDPSKPIVSITLSHNQNIKESNIKIICDIQSVRNLSFDGSTITDDALQHLVKMKLLKQLNLSFTPITGDGLRHIAPLKGLEILTLDQTKVTDSGLSNLSGLEALAVLWLDGCQIGDAGVHHILRLAALHDLCLSRTDITDTGMARLGGLPKLLALDVSDTKVTNNGLNSSTQTGKR